MKFAVVVSKKDNAGMNIKSQLKKLKLNLEIIEFDKEIIYAESIDQETSADFIIFASRHQSEKKTCSLCVHPIGNFHKAEFGGKSETLCLTSSNLLKIFFQNLNKTASKEKLENYDLTMECTHHGPYVEKPCLFIEIGSSEEQWKDEKAGKVIAETIQTSIKEAEAKQKTQEKFISAIGIGGPHYCHNFNKIQLNTDYALGHIIPEYSLPVNKEIIKQTLEKTSQKPELILLDWKGLGKSEQKQELIKTLSQIGIKLIRTREVEK
ncbi:hypothetical protein COV15_00840 [Candidatus Woesearchaeota archaeon CG10_big_fil_rev_8_21_14_0_10_34_12]|nr:MAG: hypothetical protein COV15_00840 [Candidatus Woesearchaeota archaeon CG10_big_fil_rev_8_21_14_0_10_34_12]